MDTAKLQEWIQQAREGCIQHNRREVGDEQIGELLSRSPIGKDKIWPHEAVRDAIEQCESLEIETGIISGLVNHRGVSSRAWGEGGEQERAIAEKYRRQAEQIRYDWPRTSSMVLCIAENYEFEAVFWDNKEEL